MKACLLGRTLKHSFSKEIHQQLGTPYFLEEVEPQHLAQLVASGKWDFFNVTIPYKQDIIPLLDGLDDTALSVGAVNTVARKNGKLVGYNTDIDGMEYMLARKSLSLLGKHVVVLGTGGTSKTAQALLKKHKAASVTVVGRNERWNYGNLAQLSATQVIINTTPVGMYPDCGGCLADLSVFPHLQFVADVVYNPQKTQLLLEAEKLGLPCVGGLPMLVYQAVKAEEIWQGRDFSFVAEELISKIQRKVGNIVLVGMPSSGKTTVGQMLAEKLGKRFVDLDQEAERADGRTVPQIFAESGEEYFRNLEASLAKQWGKESGLVIATGGGTPVREENRDALRQNGFVVWLRRDLSLLSSENRPVTQQKGVQKIFEERKGLYQAVSDCIVQNSNSVRAAVEQIKQAYEKNSCN